MIINMGENDMSLALKCDFCKDFFTFKDKTLPNTIGFGRIYESDGGVKLNTYYNIAPDIIKKNAYNVSSGVYTFIVCNKCAKKIMNLIVEKDENNDNA